MNSIWLVITIIGALTYLTSLSFIFLVERWQPPQALTRALRYVPVAALTGIFIPEILLHESAAEMGFINPRLLAGIIAILVAWRTKSALWTIGFGMGLFWLLTYLM